MESEYLMYVDASSQRYQGTADGLAASEAAADRLQHRINTGNTLVSVLIKNPRYKVR